MTTRKRFKCRFCATVPPAWLPAAKRPNSALLLGQLSQLHPDQVGPYLEQRRTECITTVVAEAYNVVEEPPLLGGI
jgi:hypothetical protein